MDWTDKRPIADLRLGSEWEPKLLYFMEKHPWPESEFIFVKPSELPADQEKAFKSAQLQMWKRRMEGIPTAEALKAWADEHAMRIRAVHEILKACGCTIAEDIKNLGCTGVAAIFPGETGVEIANRIGVDLFGSSAVRRPFPDNDNLTDQMNAVTSAHPIIEVIRFLRLGLAGSGVGLPCFVPPNRYCHGHEITGGLQDRQVQLYPEQVSVISRELLPEERAHNRLIEEAQHASEERGAAEMLRGRRMPEGWLREDTDGGEAMSPVSPMTTAASSGMPDVAGAARVQLPRRQTPRASSLTDDGDLIENSFRCPEHRTPDWRCRFCTAQMVVEGDLEPTYVVQLPAGTQTNVPVPVYGIAANDALKLVEQLDATGVDRVYLNVRVATFTRKLAR